MILLIEKAPRFHADVTHQFRWYFDEAGEDLAWRFFEATDQSLTKLARNPELGRRRNFHHPRLDGLGLFR